MPEKHDDLYAVLGQMDAGRPQEPHWYLAWLGVDGAMQGRGLARRMEMTGGAWRPSTRSGSCLLGQHQSAQCPVLRASRLPVTGESQAGACPRLIAMLRDAR